MKRVLLVVWILYLFGINSLNSQVGYWGELKPKNSPPARASFGMCDIGTKKVILFGGIVDKNPPDRYVNDTWIYDIDANNWTEVETYPKPEPRFNHRLARINDTKVLLFGGTDGYHNFGDTWIFDLDSNHWFKMNPLKSPSAREEHALSQLLNGKVLLYSGWVGTGFDYVWDSNYWIYDYENKTWDSVTFRNKLARGSKIASAPLDTGSVITFGGWSGQMLDNTCIFNYSENLWHKIITDSIPLPSVGSSMANLFNGSVILFGGSGAYDNQKFLDQTFIFSIKDTAWNRVQIISEKPIGRSQHCLAKIDDGRILLFGGSLHDGSKANDTWLFVYEGSDVEETADLKDNYYLNDNELIISCNDFGNTNSVEISIFNVVGECVKNPIPETQNPQPQPFSQWEKGVRVDVSDLNSGVYFFRFSNGKKELTGKFLKY